MRKFRKIATIVLLGALGVGKIDAQAPGQGVSDVLSRAGAMADPATRARVVALLQRQQASERERGVELARALNLPLREVRANGKVTEVAGIGLDGLPL